MSLFQDLQRRIDSLGFVHPEITSGKAEEWTAPVAGKEEYEYYQNNIYISNDRAQRYLDYEEMAQYPEIASALDIYADDATQKDSSGHKIQIISKNKRIKEELEFLFYRTLNIDANIRGIVRQTCLNGDSFWEIVMRKDKKAVVYLKHLPAKSMIRYEQNGKLMGFIQQLPVGGTIPYFEPFEIVHFKVNDSTTNFRPYGTSILDAARRHWRQLKLMEDAMVVYRVSRAPERRIFFINTGNLPTAQAEQYLEKIRMKFRKKAFVNPKTGEIDYRANQLSADEDFFIPVRNGQESTRIDQLQGAQNLGEVDDVKYFKDKIFALLKIPRIYLQDIDGTAENKRTNLSQQDIRFARTIESIQDQLLTGFYKVAMTHLMLRGYEKKDLYDFELRMTPCSDVAEMGSAELVQTRIANANGYWSLGFSKKWIAKSIFKLEAEEWECIRKERFDEDLEQAKHDAKVQELQMPPPPPMPPGMDGGDPNADPNMQAQDPNQAGMQQAVAPVDPNQNAVTTHDIADDVMGMHEAILDFMEKKKINQETPKSNYFQQALLEGEFDGLLKRSVEDQKIYEETKSAKIKELLEGTK